MLYTGIPILVLVGFVWFNEEYGLRRLQIIEVLPVLLTAKYNTIGSGENFLKKRLVVEKKMSQTSLARRYIILKLL